MVVFLCTLPFIIAKDTNVIIVMPEKKAFINIEKIAKSKTPTITEYKKPTRPLIKMMTYWILYFVLSLGSQSILEWKYLKGSKQYVTTLIFLIIGILVIYNIEYLAPLFGWS